MKHQIQILPNSLKKWYLQIPNIRKFTEKSVIQILISPNTHQRPQITPNTNFLWLFGTPNVKACTWSYSVCSKKWHWDDQKMGQKWHNLRQLQTAISQARNKLLTNFQKLESTARHGHMRLTLGCHLTK